MIEILLEIGLTANDIQNIREFINEDNNQDLIENIKLLGSIGCNQNHLKNIIIGNPFFLQRSSSDISKLISYLHELGLTYLNLLFDSYPTFLNKDSFEVKDFIDKEISNGKLLEDVIDEIDSMPYIIDEV